MARKFLLLFLLFIVVCGLSIWGYFVWNEIQYDDSAVNISKSSHLTKSSSTTSEYLPKTQIHPLPYSPESINFNQKIMQKTVENIDNKQLKKAIVLKSGTLKSNVSETGFQKSHFQIHPQFFQSLFLESIASKLNFLNLKLEFGYYDNYQKVKVKISNSDYLNNKVFKNFQINILNTLEANE